MNTECVHSTDSLRDKRTIMSYTWKACRKTNLRKIQKLSSSNRHTVLTIIDRRTNNILKNRKNQMTVCLYNYKTQESNIELVSILQEINELNIRYILWASINEDFICIIIVSCQLLHKVTDNHLQRTVFWVSDILIILETLATSSDYF